MVSGRNFSVSNENSLVFNFQLVNIPLIPKGRSKRKDCINMPTENHRLHSSCLLPIPNTLGKPLHGWNPKLFQ